jgi:hypothetical protein
MSDGHPDGRIAVKELKEGLEGFGLFLSRAELNTLGCSLQCDTEGQISLQEFEELTHRFGLL